jgi:hypothetical protein
MMNFIGLSQLSSSETWFIMILAFCAAMAIGYIFHFVMGAVGFGIGGNTVIAMLAIYAGLYGYHRYSGKMQSPDIPIMLAFVIGSIMISLLVLSILRRILKL